MIGFLSRRQPFDLDNSRLVALQDAIRGRHLVRLRYHAFGTDAVTERRVEPRRLQYSGGAWYLNAYCLARQGPRDFRLERIDQMAVLPDTFEPRELLEDADSSGSDPLAEVSIRFEHSVLRWVREWQHQGFVSEDPPAPNGSVVMRYRVEAPLEMRPWLFSWGADAIVLEPPGLRDAQRAAAVRLLDRLGAV